MLQWKKEERIFIWQKADHVCPNEWKGDPFSYEYWLWKNVKAAKKTSRDPSCFALDIILHLKPLNKQNRTFLVGTHNVLQERGASNIK